MHLLGGKCRLHGFQAAIGLGLANPGRQAFFTLAHARHHVLGSLGGMNGGGDGDARQVEEVLVRQQVQFGLQQRLQLLPQRLLRAVGHVLLCGNAVP
ncbi:hypothetical protein D3C78_1611660 [compost metagenome]